METKRRTTNIFGGFFIMAELRVHCVKCGKEFKIKINSNTYVLSAIDMRCLDCGGIEHSMGAMY